MRKSGVAEEVEMKDFVVYHNPDSMGVDVRSMDALSIVTDKKIRDVQDSRVWLLTGKGSPRVFLLRSYFIVDRIENNTEGFQTKLSAKKGRVFDPMVEMNQEGWFDDFKKSQGNFAFGLQRIKEDRFVRGLEGLAGEKRREP